MLHHLRNGLGVLLAGILLPVGSVVFAQEEELDEAELILQNGFESFNSNRRWLSTQICRLPDERLATLVDNGVIFSGDGMASWSERIPIMDPMTKSNHPGSIPDGDGSFLVSSTGEWHVAWRDPRRPSELEEYWDKDLDGPVDDAVAAVWVTTSTDQGLTWSQPQKVFDAPGGYPPKEMLETKSGTLVMPIQYHQRSPGRNIISGVRSTDRGKTWMKFSNEIDIGGRGHHDGALEPTVVELNDGRVWMIFRTTKGHLWQSFSSDDGKTWSTPESTSISSSSSPPYAGRLNDGRLLLLWNRETPADGDNYRKRGGDGYFSEVVTSWNRKELSLATSHDDGATWSKEIIVARHPKNGRISYPYFFEDDSGNIFIFANQGKLETTIPSAKLP